MLYQIKIPAGLSESRYISGMAALNLPAPEGTSGDWHFLNVFYRDTENVTAVTLAGEGEQINTNHIFKDYGIYRCNEALEKRGLKAEGDEAYAANHFRAILDLLYERIKNEGKYPSYLYGASEDYLDTEEEKKILLEKTAMMLPYLSEEEQIMLLQWINKERAPGYRG